MGLPVPPAAQVPLVAVGSLAVVMEPLPVPSVENEPPMPVHVWPLTRLLLDVKLAIELSLFSVTTPMLFVRLAFEQVPAPALPTYTVNWPLVAVAVSLMQSDKELLPSVMLSVVGPNEVIMGFPFRSLMPKL